MKVEESFGLIEYNNVFEIPIYRLSNDKFVKELKSQVDRSIEYNYTRKELINLMGDKGAKIYDSVRSDIFCMSEYNWKFNEIVGWITLCLNQEIIFGEIFLNEAKRIRKNSLSKISFYDCGFKIRFNKNNTNLEIFNNILLELNNLKKRTKFKNRYIDTSKFETIGSFIDWKKLYQNLNDFEY